MKVKERGEDMKVGYDWNEVYGYGYGTGWIDNFVTCLEHFCCCEKGVKLVHEVVG